MARSALTAFLAIVTALGPVYCCCSVRQLFGSHREGSCCARTGASGRHVTHSHLHSHSHTPSRLRHASQSSNNSPADAKTSLPRDGGRSNRCSCDRHRVYVSTHDPTSSDGLFKPLDICTVCSECGPFTFSVAESSHCAGCGLFRPANLCGRDILRALQTLRC